jgi:hypothetical protein
MRFEISARRFLIPLIPIPPIVTIAAHSARARLHVITAAASIWCAGELSFAANRCVDDAFHGSDPCGAAEKRD